MRDPGGACRTTVLVAILAAFLPVFLFNCTMSPTAGGSTDTETGGVVAGVVIDSSGAAVSNTQLQLIPVSYNPVEDEPIPAEYTDTTDSAGTYRFEVEEDGDYNIQAVHSADRTRLLTTNISLSKGATVTDTSEITDPGMIILLLPDTVDTNDGYVYVRGTQIYKKLRENISLYSGYYAITLDSIPAADLPPLLFSIENQTGKTAVITNTLTVNSRDTVAFGTTGEELKPLWRISLQVAVNNDVAQHYGGIDMITPHVIEQLSDMTKKFNRPNVFAGIIHFAPDSIYEFDTDIQTEGSKPLDGYDFRFLYDNESLRESQTDGARDNIFRFSYIYIWNSDPADIFNDYMSETLLELLGELRGCLDLSWLTVDSDDNQVNGEGYSGVNSIMNSPFDYDVWDDYSISVLDHNADIIGSERDILYTAFPDIMGMLIKLQNGTPVPGAEVNVYGSELNSGSIDATPIVTGTADSNGRFLFSTNPFKDTKGEIIYGTLLLSAVFEGDTTYEWLPMNEAGNAYFANPDTTLLVELSF